MTCRSTAACCGAGAGAGTVLEASCGQTAYELYKAGGGPATFCLVLMDCRMPGMDGWQATEHIRLLERACGWAPVPVVACTTEDLSPGSPALQRCWDCGMNAATGKPLSRDAASQLLQQWAGVGAGATAAGSCRSSDNGSTCALGGGDKPAGGAASGGCSSASLADAESASAGRSSLDSEGGSLPRRICHALSCGLYAGGTVQ